jgi:hypothetical protein
MPAIDTIVAEIDVLAIAVVVFGADDIRSLVMIVAQIFPIIPCFSANLAIKHIKEEKHEQFNNKFDSTKK